MRRRYFVGVDGIRSGYGSFFTRRGAYRFAKAWASEGHTAVVIKTTRDRKLNVIWTPE